MRVAASIVLAFASFACAAAFAGVAGDRDAAVYAAVFAAISAGAANPPAIVVRDRTATVDEMTKMMDPQQPVAQLRQRMPAASERLVQDLVARAKQPRTLTKAELAQATSVKAEVVPEADVRHAFDDPKVPMSEAWQRLAQKHGGARSVVTLSPVGYDDAVHGALVYLRTECGGLCGGATLLRLEEKDGKWRVVETQPLWVS